MQRDFSNDLSQSTFFWRWVYPFLLVIVWGGILGMIILILGENEKSLLEKIAGGFVGGASISLILWIMYNTPFNKVIQLLLKIPYVWIAILPFWLCYWVFVWPITLLDKLIALVYETRYKLELSKKSFR